MHSVKYDIIVIGAGPAGCAAALEAEQKGFKCLILEKEIFPRYKVCGGGLLIKKNCYFDYLNDFPYDRAFQKILISLNGTNLQYQVERKQSILYTVMRETFDHFLFKKIDASKVEKRTETEVLQIEAGEGQVKIITNQGSYMGSFVIAADGAHSRIARICGWKEDRILAPALECELPFKGNFDELRFDIGFVPKGYAWVFPKKDFLSIGLGKFSRKKVRINLREYLKKYFDFLEIDFPNDLPVHSSVIPISPRKEALHKHNVLLCGDAAGLADPIVAEGITFAMLSGKLAIEAIDEAQSSKFDAGSLYQQKIDHSILKNQNKAMFLNSLLYDHSSIRNFVFKKRGKLIVEKFTDYYLMGKSFPSNLTSMFLKFVKYSKG